MQDDVARQTTLANWRSAPWCHWAFHHVEQVVPTDIIARGDGAPLALAERPQALGAFRLALPGGRSFDLAQFLAATHSDGFLVLKDGAIVHEAYGNGLDAGQRHIVMSASKSVTGLVGGLLAAQGRLDLGAEVARYVPEIAATGYSGATVRQLLDMRADPAFDAHDLEAYDRATNWRPVPDTDGTPTLHRFFESLPARPGRHGGPFRYLSANTDLMGWVIERAAGACYAAAVSDLLWRPMGAGADAAVTLDRAGAARATGGVCATLRDLARLGQLLVQDGRRGDAEVIPRALIDDIATAGDAAAWEAGEFAASFGGLPMHYRSGWYVLNGRPQVLFAMGIHGQNLFVDRAHRLVIAKLSSQPEPLDRTMIGLIQRAVPEIRRCLAA